MDLYVLNFIVKARVSEYQTNLPPTTVVANVLNIRVWPTRKKTDWHQLNGVTHWTQRRVDSEQERFSTGLPTPGTHDDVIKWIHFPRYWPFVRRIHRSPVNSPHKGQWRGALIFFFDLRLNSRSSKRWWDRWFETLSCPLWCHRNGRIDIILYRGDMRTCLRALTAEKIPTMGELLHESEPDSNVGVGISKKHSTAHSCVQRPNHPALGRLV